MSHDAEMTAILPTAKPPARSAAAERMRLHRDRRRQGLRCFTIELRETEIDALIRKGLLKAETRNDPCAIVDGLYVGFGAVTRNNGNLLPAWQRGQSGNPLGRPQGSRNKLSEAFL